MRANSRFSGLWPGLILVSVGGGLLAREFGYLPPNVRLVDFWPLIVVCMGITSLLHRRGFLGALFSLAFVALGGFLLACNLGLVAFPAARLWPALLVLLGLAFLLRGGRRAGFRGPRLDPPPGGVGDGSQEPSGPCSPDGKLTSSEDRFRRQITFSGAQFKIESQAWKGGELGVTLGGVELDLRNARLDPEGALLTLNVVGGGVDIRVPDTWQVYCDVTPLLGGADDTTRSTQGATNAPRLRVVGTVTMGGVNVRN